ncbi:Uncharacterised protein [Veillonella criceti]|uniref:Uncharacterized protein n=2 Tax=Veillonella criceti TaxID=103891 RepID=A0A380NML5_9FIRM|nr:Uncharacterised protein [Veillonella criceti]
MRLVFALGAFLLPIAVGIMPVWGADADISMDPTDTWAPERAAVNKMAVRLAESLEAQKSQEAGVDLTAVGKSYTADTLEPMKASDFKVRDFALGMTEPALTSESLRSSLSGDQVGQTTGDFTTYTGEAGSYTVYSGPTFSNLDSNKILRKEGLTYAYQPRAITNIHITSADIETERGIFVGKSRGAVLFAYGAPQAMWRDLKKGTVSLIYFFDSRKIFVKNKQEFTSAVANDNKVSTAVLNPETDRAIAQYLVFTLKDNKVNTIDMIDGQVWTHLRLPAITPQYYKANQLADDDFMLMGYRVNRPFVTNQDEQWQQRGFLYGDEFIAYDDILIGYDKHQTVARAMITKSTALTRRGISIGDSKYLLLYLYGMPSEIEADTGANGESLMVYTYKNPDSAYSYLLFTVGEKDNFIKSVMLSDRPNKELSK